MSRDELQNIATIANERVIELENQLAQFGRIWRKGKIEFVKKTQLQNRLIRTLALKRMSELGGQHGCT